MRPTQTGLVLILLAVIGVPLGLYFVLHTSNQTQYVPAFPSITIAGVVVPHDALVAGPRADFFSTLAASMVAPTTIILLSPNHYYAGYGHIQTTDQVWHLDGGQIQPDATLIDSLLADGSVTREPSSFINEHGIYSVLGDIRKNFPKALIVPLIFQNTTMAELRAVEQRLNKSCTSCLVIASVDFSHYQPALLGQLHDERSIRDLDTLNTDDILTGAEVDSGPALALLTLWARDHDANRFVLKNHTNSGVITGNPDIESTTHVFGWYTSGVQTVPTSGVSFIIGGDVMFARMIAHTFGNDFNAAFADLGDRVFWGTDAAIVNEEGAITTQPIRDDISSANFTFLFSPRSASTLSYLHINAVSQANNHSANGGLQGVETTRSVLNAAGIQTFGGPSGGDVSRVAVFHGSGLSLTVIGVNMLSPGQTAEALVPLITEAKQDPTMRVLVMPHWGVEYSPGHTSAQAAAAHVWVDAGADIIIGSHPHVIEDSELYRGVPIIYSLGNLLFDQAFSTATQEGLLIAGSFTPDGLTLFGLPAQSVKYQPRLMTGSAKTQILDALYFPFKNFLQVTPAGTVVRMVR